jgi:hypothetical protein
MISSKDCKGVDLITYVLAEGLLLAGHVEGCCKSLARPGTKQAIYIYIYIYIYISPKLIDYGDNGHRKVGASVVSTHCKLLADSPNACPSFSKVSYYILNCIPSGW